VVAFSVEAVTPCAFTLGALAGEVRPVRGPGGAPAVARIGGLDGAPLKPRARWEEHAAAARPGTGRALTGSGAATNRRSPDRPTRARQPSLEAELFSGLGHQRASLKARSRQATGSPARDRSEERRVGKGGEAGV